MARPTKYDPALCETVLSVGESGGTLAAMAEACDIHRETLNEWLKIHPEFSDAVKRGLQKAQVLWEEKGMKGAFGELDGFNATGFIFNMKNRFKDDWRDKVETEHSGNLAITKVERAIVRPDNPNG